MIVAINQKLRQYSHENYITEKLIYNKNKKPENSNITILI